MSATATAGGSLRSSAGPGRRLARWFHAHPRLQVAALLAPPVGWMGVVYFGALALLLVSAFWYLDPVTHDIVRQLSFRNFADLIGQPAYRTIVLRTLTIAVAVTVVDGIVAFPIAFYMARVASPR